MTVGNCRRTNIPAGSVAGCSNGPVEKLFAIGVTKIADGRVAPDRQHPSLRKVAVAQSPKHDATDRQIHTQLGGFSLF